MGRLAEKIEEWVLAPRSKLKFMARAYSVVFSAIIFAIIWVISIIWLVAQVPRLTLIFVGLVAALAFVLWLIEEDE